MTNEQAIELIMSLKWDKNIDEQEDKALSMAIEALSAQTEQECEKCIFKPFKQFQVEPHKEGKYYDVTRRFQSIRL